jgi:hypothetical protein
MVSIYSYQKSVDAFTTHRLNEPRDANGASVAIELCEIDGVTYVSVPSESVLPEQPAEITVVAVALTDALRDQIKAASPHVSLINQRVVEQIREKYSADDEIKILSLPLSAESAEYNAYVRSCREWGAAEKAKLGLAPTQAETIANSVMQIDADTDAIYGTMLGNRAQEYTLAETDATAYKDAGYAGAVPASVQCWATAKGWTVTQAADDILATATAWRLAQASIRAQRLASKEAVRAAVDAAGVNTAMTTWAVFVTAIRGQLGI